MSLVDIDNPGAVSAPIAKNGVGKRGVFQPEVLTPSTRRPARKGLTRVTQGASKGLLSPSLSKSGYVPRFPFLDAVLNRSLAASALLVLSPVLAVVWLMLRLAYGRDVFYRGARLGKDAKIFQMLKFRTLHTGAQGQLTDKTLPKRTQMETRIGSYLRQSRLDELPQLFNILKGDMVFFGPRPIRPEMIPVYEAETNDFERRFIVHPGLVGYSQALLPHSASKRLRGRFNAMCTASHIRYGQMLLFCAAVGLAVAQRTLALVFQAIGHIASPFGSHVFLRSGFAPQRASTIQFLSEDGQRTGALVSLSDEVLQFVTTLPVEMGPCRVQIQRKRRNGREIRISLDVDVRAVMPVGLGQSGFAGYAELKTVSKYDSFRLERYFLGLTVLPA